MREMHAHVGLVWAFVFRESNVAIDAEQRSANRLGIGHQPWADFAKPQTQVGDEAQAWLPGELLVFRLVLEKPGAAVIAAQLCQKPKQAGSEIRLAHRLSFRQVTEERVR